jgi:hypothetical protein
MIGPVLILAFWAVLVWLWAHPEWFAPEAMIRYLLLAWRWRRLRRRITLWRRIRSTIR